MLSALASVCLGLAILGAVGASHVATWEEEGRRVGGVLILSRKTCPAVRAGNRLWFSKYTVYQYTIAFLQSFIGILIATKEDFFTVHYTNIKKERGTDIER